jgi:hypothetical protein
MRHHAILHFRVQSDVVPWMFLGKFSQDSWPSGVRRKGPGVQVRGVC